MYVSGFFLLPFLFNRKEMLKTSASILGYILSARINIFKNVLIALLQIQWNWCFILIYLFHLGKKQLHVFSVFMVIFLDVYFLLKFSSCELEKENGLIVKRLAIQFKNNKHTALTIQYFAELININQLVVTNDLNLSIYV